MLPFRDDVQARRFPLVTIAVIFSNLAVFFYELSVPSPLLEELIFRYGVIPARLGQVTADPVATLGLFGVNLFTSMFLHGGWFHLLGNVWYLWIFGDNVEDRMGRFRFLLFYLLCGLIAGAIHTFFNLSSTIPSIGASGAIAGVLGAYLVSFPFARVLTLVPLFLFWPIIELPAILVLGSWFLIQLLNGTAAVAVSSQTAGGVAWWAHIGGFLAGMMLLTAFLPGRRTRPRW